MYNLYLSLLASQLCAYPDNPYICTHKSKADKETQSASIAAGLRRLSLLRYQLCTFPSTSYTMHHQPALW